MQRLPTLVPFCQQIKGCREEQGLLLTDLARMAGVLRGYLSEKKNNPSAQRATPTLFKIASTLSTCVGTVLGRNDPDSQSAKLHIPESLCALAGKTKLPDPEIWLLAGIGYSGKLRKTIDHFGYLYESVSLGTEGR